MKNMSKSLTRVLCVVMALAMVLALAACGTTATPTAAPATAAPATATPEPATLVVGYSNFSQKFSPFFAKTAYDQDAALMTQLSLLGADREGNPVLKGIEGETIAYNGTDYFYDGIADIDVVQNSDNTVDYNVTLKDGILFSDGEPLTIDDVIFNMYVYSDPTYDGSSTFYSLPIEGMQEYRNAMQSLSSLILAAGPDNTDFSKWTQDQQTAYWTAFNAAGEKFAQEIVDYCIANGYNATGDSVAACAANWGYTLAEDATAADFFQAMVDAYGYDVSDTGINRETAGTSITDFINAELGDSAASYTAGVNVGEAVPSITGITKTGDNTLTVHCTKFEATTIYQFQMAIAPLHYYGDTAKYDYANNMFGFTKGDLSGVKSKTTQPLGAGAYKFISYENGVISYEANENYWKGEPRSSTSASRRPPTAISSPAWWAAPSISPTRPSPTTRPTPSRATTPTAS